jgi:SAM-dependent methyltransferase
MPEQPSQREYWSGKAGDEWAAHADRIDAMLAPVTEAALAAGAFQAGERVLDIGCGAGATSLKIANRVGPSGRVTGVDISPQLVRVARERARAANVAAEFIEADAGSSAFGADFDAAFSRFGVMFFEAPAQAFAHIRSAMRTDGRLAFACWRAMAGNAWATTPIAAILPMLKAPLPPPDPDAPGPYSLADAGKVERILREAGWRDVALAPWEGEVALGGGGSLEEIADFMFRIGPFSRVIAEQNLDADEARDRLTQALAPHYQNGAISLSGACWIVTARA